MADPGNLTRITIKTRERSNILALSVAAVFDRRQLSRIHPHPALSRHLLPKGEGLARQLAALFGVAKCLWSRFRRNPMMRGLFVRICKLQQSRLAVRFSEQSNSHRQTVASES